MGMHEYLQGLSELEMVVRAPGYFKYQGHSVAAHSWKVTQAAQFLGDIEDINGNEVNWQKLYEKALNHDYTERFIGDIKTPVKYATHNLRMMLADVEASLTENFIENEIPDELAQRYKRRLIEGKDDSLEGRILSVADKLDLLYEAFGEIQKGNPEPVFIEIYKESLETMLAFADMPSVNYIIDHVLPEMLDQEFADRGKLMALTKAILN
ncbi:YfbR-like 5'-deoxynucleotidase [Periweissella beninensis]|uniref:HD domain-containing protein n=1 Tax=Periweissella beninensis TaxID=504936 RepID=A0ABT0VJM7_9LACO|nr:YfbR-like 5'-deoxynucleotidase [Periweissella beninensis]MBM7544394.1 putative hydrolase of HD superfamily [Periweissella beninensis]MCM2437840.1 HD domain-containing protein [Periweissella beninensis]MCT4396297.1 HD domain-containing protein [Periweissella beninensis]